MFFQIEVNKLKFDRSVWCLIIFHSDYKFTILVMRIIIWVIWWHEFRSRKNYFLVTMPKICLKKKRWKEITVPLASINVFNIKTLKTEKIYHFLLSIPDIFPLHILHLDPNFQCLIRISFHHIDQGTWYLLLQYHKNYCPSQWQSLYTPDLKSTLICSPVHEWCSYIYSNCGAYC